MGPVLNGLRDTPEMQLPVAQWPTLKSVAVTGWVLSFHTLSIAVFASSDAQRGFTGLF